MNGKLKFVVFETILVNLTELCSFIYKEYVFVYTYWPSSGQKNTTIKRQVTIQFKKRHHILRAIPEVYKISLVNEIVKLCMVDAEQFLEYNINILFY